MEEIKEIDLNKCEGCGSTKKLFMRFSRCNVCAKPFCKSCCFRANYSFKDRILLKKYCYSCYVVIENSKKEGNSPIQESENEPGSSTDFSTPPTNSQVTHKQFQQIIKEYLIVNTVDISQKYYTLRLIGKGSFSEVYLAQKKNSETLYAIKKMRPFNATEERLFVNEFALTKLSQHPNIIIYGEIYKNGIDYFIVMELMQITLTRILKHLKDHRIILYIFKEILNAIRYLHKNNRIHRDLKSDNILINLNGQVKLADLGFAVQLTEERNKRQTLAGTPCWIAPEIINRDHYDTKVDIWSLGVLLIELVDGEPPHLRLKQPEIFRKIITGQMVLKNPDMVHEDLKTIIDLCLKQQPEERMSAEEIFNLEILQNLPTQAEFANFIASLN